MTKVTPGSSSKEQSVRNAEALVEVKASTFKAGFIELFLLGTTIAP